LTEKHFAGFCTKHSRILMLAFINNNDAKYFHITESTKKRIKNVPTEKITGGKMIKIVKAEIVGMYESHLPK
jgi:hypothetical protein